MFNKILIANRGEIAVRVIRACREMGILSVAVYSEEDRESLHVELADEAVCIGRGPSKDSYLNIQNIISAAVITNAEAIHPGFGFLSENSEFAKICEKCNIKFIGPKSETITLMGNKSKAKEIMKKNNVPIIEGSEGEIKSIQEAISLCKKIGFPVMIKASAGGGGRGIRIVNSFEELKISFETAKQEAINCFNDGSLYLEKYIKNPHHIEFQILGDSFGNIIHLGERDCSIQRRNQKVLEEAPSSFLSAELREKMGNAAINAAKAVNYENAGTIEFLVDDTGNFYFMEMNTRVQVEHPITEMITNVDIVKEQLSIAYGNKLRYSQKDIKIVGNAIECRIMAENPDLDFRPSPGKITALINPGGRGIRVDSGVYEGFTISPYYDSMIAKIISYGENREEAISIMKRALYEMVVLGVETNIEYQLNILCNDDFNRGVYDTSFLSKMVE